MMVSLAIRLPVGLTFLSLSSANQLVDLLNSHITHTVASQSGRANRPEGQQRRHSGLQS